MISFIFGVLGFGLFFLYDINSVKWQNRILHLTFLAGCIILAGSTAWQVIQGVSVAVRRPVFWGCLVLAVFFFLLLIDTLFFALPFDETYIETNGKGRVYDKGMYALCRHPGVLWFFLFYLFLGLALWPSPMLCMGMVYSLFNLFYIIFQDFWSFPRTFDGYEDYKKEVPFLIPDRKSIRRAYRTRRGKH